MRHTGCRSSNKYSIRESSDSAILGIIFSCESCRVRSPLLQCGNSLRRGWEYPAIGMSTDEKIRRVAEPKACIKRRQSLDTISPMLFCPVEFAPSLLLVSFFFFFLSFFCSGRGVRCASPIFGLLRLHYHNNRYVYSNTTRIDFIVESTAKNLYTQF